MSKNCCHNNSSAKGDSENKDCTVKLPGERKNAFARLYGAIKCAVPGTILILLPKCPICLAAWISAVSGLGISISVAGYLRWGLIIVCVTSLFYFAIGRFKKSFQNRNIAR